MSSEDEESQRKTSADEVSQPKTSADPFSTFLTGIAGVAAASMVGGPITAPIAAATAGVVLAYALQRTLRERSKSAAGKAHARDIDSASVAVLLYVADGQKHTTSEAARALAMSNEEIRSAIDALKENNLLESSYDGVDENIALSPEGRSTIIQLSSEMAS